jgi:hypothetical protein
MKSWKGKIAETISKRNIPHREWELAKIQLGPFLETEIVRIYRKNDKNPDSEPSKKSDDSIRIATRSSFSLGVHLSSTKSFSFHEQGHPSTIAIPFLQSIFYLLAQHPQQHIDEEQHQRNFLCLPLL